MSEEPRRPDSWKERLRKFWHTEDPTTAVVRDVAVAGGIVVFLLALIWLYAGQPLSQAPVVSVESGSMMHGPYVSGRIGHPSAYGHPSFGRIGTIDPGDIVFVKRVKSATDVEVAFGQGSRHGYGGHGDVIVFKPDGSGQKTRVIHRAMIFIQAVPEGCTPNVDCVYKIPAVCNNPGLDEWNKGEDLEKYCAGSSDPIRLNLQRDGLFLQIDQPFPCAPGAGACAPFYSGFITKGDNNEAPDQVTSISRTVQLNWIIGKARGEIPWFGLIKLALYGNPTYNVDTDPTRGDNWKILRASAPWDIWTALLLSLAILIAIPMALDYVSNLRAKKEQEQQGKQPPPPPRPPY